MTVVTNTGILKRDRNECGEISITLSPSKLSPIGESDSQILVHYLLNALMGLNPGILGSAPG
jgi:hypothetical protein